MRASPLSSRHEKGGKQPLSKHHHQGRYGRFLDTGLQGMSASPARDRYDRRHKPRADIDEDARSESSVVVRTDLRPIESPLRKPAFTRSMASLQDAPLERSPSLTSLGSVDLATVLLPVNDPLLDMPPSPTRSSSSDSWESTTSDSGSSKEDQGNDDAEDAFLDLDPRFIDVGWGGECLRESEDIDFEFVYALHTFVATVEGQANATKGDTMVLLDDSNSYWWLVRVVKDSSIGEFVNRRGMLSASLISDIRLPTCRTH